MDKSLAPTSGRDQGHQYLKKKPRARGPIPEEKTCEWCGGVFKRKWLPSGQWTPGTLFVARKYCSRECSAAARTHPTPEKRCETCGDLLTRGEFFIRRESVADTVARRFCSPKCAGKRLRGEGSATKLTGAQVLEIRTRYRKGDRMNGGAPLAEEFGVDQATISLLVRGLRWPDGPWPEKKP